MNEPGLALAISHAQHVKRCLERGGIWERTEVGWATRYMPEADLYAYLTDHLPPTVKPLVLQTVKLKKRRSRRNPNGSRG